MQCRVLDTTFRLVGDHFGIVGEDILMRDTIEGKQQWGDVEIAVIDILSLWNGAILLTFYRRHRVIQIFYS